MIGIYVNNVTVRLSVCLLLTFFPYKTPNKCYTHISDRFSICGKPPAYKCTKHIKLMCLIIFIFLCNIRNLQSMTDKVAPRL